jgi:hypothetical protein
LPSSIIEWPPMLNVARCPDRSIIGQGWIPGSSISNMNFAAVGGIGASGKLSSSQ